MYIERDRETTIWVGPCSFHDNNWLQVSCNPSFNQILQKFEPWLFCNKIPNAVSKIPPRMKHLLMPWHHSNFMILDNCSQLKRGKNVMRIGTRSIHTVSPARISGSSKPRDCLLKSRSQHRNREAPKCLIPSMHCNMVTSAVQNTPCLLERYR